MEYPHKRAALYGLPFYVRSGYINLTVSAGTLRYVGQWGNGWLSQASSTSAYRFYLDTLRSFRLGSSWTSAWFPLRCLSTVLGM